jgi:hypothetical protein
MSEPKVTVGMILILEDYVDPWIYVVTNIIPGNVRYPNGRVFALRLSPPWHRDVEIGTVDNIEDDLTGFRPAPNRCHWRVPE